MKRIIAALLLGAITTGGCSMATQSNNAGSLPRPGEIHSQPAPTSLAALHTPPGIPDAWSDGYVYANGIRIHYYHAPSVPGKPVIVMCHGVTDIGLCWTTLTWKLQDSYDIYMLDARGHGLSDPSTPSDTRDTMVKDVVDVVHALKLEKPILMGHSMGASTVMHIGAEYPDLARAIIMLDPGLTDGGGPGGRGGRGGISRASAPSTGPARGAVGGRGAPPPGTPSGTPGRFSLTMFGSPEALVAQNNHSYEDLVAICHRDNPKWGIVDCEYWALSKKQYHGNYNTDQRQPTTVGMSTSEALAKIAVPALILKADAPPATRAANEEAAKVMQHGKLVHIDGAAHNLHHDQLARTVEVIKDFLVTVK
jgi:pimeloyl-ACP methyl ester carboxylesterase